MKRKLKIGDSQIITISDSGTVTVPASAEIWMTQHEVADLFGCFVAKVNANIRSILKSEVLDETKICRTYRYGNGNSVEQYNMEMVIALAFRIRSHNADLLRAWIIRKAITDTSGQQILVVGDWKNYNISPN